MKFLIVLALIALANALDQEFLEEFMEKVQTIAENCVQEQGANDDDLAELVAKKFPPTSHEAKCVLFCIHKKFGLQKEDGSLDKIGALRALDPLKDHDPELYEKVLHVFISCGEKITIDADPCITSSNMAVCGNEESAAAGIDDILA